MHLLTVGQLSNVSSQLSVVHNQLTTLRNQLYTVHNQLSPVSCQGSAVIVGPLLLQPGANCPVSHHLCSYF